MLADTRIAGSLAAMFFALLLSACGTSDDSVVNIAVIGDKDEPFEKGVYLSPPAQLVRAATAEGLVAFDDMGRVVPALADRWIVTDDGQSYIFRLRDGTWKDGTPLTAESARAALRKSISALKGTSLGLDVAGVDDIRVMAQRVIEIRLTNPRPNLLQLLAQPELGLQRNGRGAGPMKLERVEDTAVLVPLPPDELGLPAVEDWPDRVRTMRMSAADAKEAVDRFNRGDADLLLGGRFENFPLASSVGLLRGTIKLDPVMGLFGLSVLNDKGFLETPGNREALAMAINREALIQPLGLGGWKPTTRIVAPEVDDDLGTIGERWEELNFEQRRALAASRVATWLASQENAESVELRIAMPEGPGTDLVFARLAGDLQAIGIKATRAGEKDKPDLELIDDIARYPRTAWFLNRLNCKVRKSLCDKEADARAAEALKAQDPAEQAALLAEAEAELTLANVFIPFGAPIRWSLVRGSASGFATNPWGWHPLMPMALRPK
ncbi:MAG: ABC transporter substrate-binding protein [Novosphingobium sp.]|nr:ABC transporter substrate-binding protein [Novosphingobium sp.]